jgi:hypothetical protein
VVVETAAEVVVAVEGMVPVTVVEIVVEPPPLVPLVPRAILVIVVEPPHVPLVPRATLVIAVGPGEVSPSAAVSRRHACGAERDASGQRSHGNYSCCDSSDLHRSSLTLRYLSVTVGDLEP